LKLSHAAWIAALAGTALCVAIHTLYPWLLIQTGTTPRTAAGQSLWATIALCPVGGLAMAGCAWLGSQLRVTGLAWGTLLLLGVPSVANGIFCGALAEAIVRARTRQPVLFWVPVLVPSLYGLSALAILTFA
jgi:hypothetical protein